MFPERRTKYIPFQFPDGSGRYAGDLTEREREQLLSAKGSTSHGLLRLHLDCDNRCPVKPIALVVASRINMPAAA